ncbi:DNA-binding response regulator [Polycladomyces abyssicola]|uniref:DNA-binding response regulator n=1 Tax=Polycladomyces abyssicola TaxID=1125966 RepID=A0A8D5UG34_9BACL|nr:response regulator transcription factor [Polycladomyces abyssicola]BCU82916.1 DNA-binding response regulator [Polycladomyces abyssicola]
MAGKRVLIIEDEPQLARFLELEFTHEGYQVIVEHDGRTGLDLALSQEFQVIILDIMLPDLSGLEVCRRIRAERNTPIIMLTARDAVPDRVSGLEAGADDYMTKPFAIEELLARVRAIQRRVAPEQTQMVEVGCCRLFPEQRRVVCADKELKLTAREFDLLACLMQNRNRVMTREMILDRVWGYDYEGDTNIVDVYVRYVRSKLEEIGVKDYIETVRGVGYVIREDGHAH